MRVPKIIEQEEEKDETIEKRTLLGNKSKK